MNLSMAAIFKSLSIAVIKTPMTSFTNGRSYLFNDIQLYFAIVRAVTSCGMKATSSLSNTLILDRTLGVVGRNTKLLQMQRGPSACTYTIHSTFTENTVIMCLNTSLTRTGRGSFITKHENLVKVKRRTVLEVVNLLSTNSFYR